MSETATVPLDRETVQQALLREAREFILWCREHSIALAELELSGLKLSLADMEVLQPPSTKTASDRSPERPSNYVARFGEDLGIPMPDMPEEE